MTTILSKAEERVKKLLDTGASTKQIGFKLGIKESTVKFHLTRIYRKSGVKNRAEFLALYRQKDLELSFNERDVLREKVNIIASFDKKYDVIVARKHNNVYMFKTQRGFCQFIKCSGRDFYKALEKRRFKGYTLSILKGMKYE